MANSVVNTLVEFGYVRNDELKAELSAMSLSQLITDFILPRVVVVGGQDTRGWRLSPDFMKLMARHAREFIQANTVLGEMLFELALQRIQRHPELKAIDYQGILPAEYRKYSATWDQPGLWGDEECTFIRLRLVDGLKLSNEKYREHAKALIFEILKKVSPVDCGYTSGWIASRTEVSNSQIWQWAVDMAVVACGGVRKVAEELLQDGDWRSHKAFLALYSASLDWEEIFAKIDLNKEEYYTGVKRGVLKLFGLYKGKTKQRIMEEIRSAKKC